MRNILCVVGIYDYFDYVLLKKISVFSKQNYTKVFIYSKLDDRSNFPFDLLDDFEFFPDYLDMLKYKADILLLDQKFRKKDIDNSKAIDKNIERLKIMMDKVKNNINNIFYLNSNRVKYIPYAENVFLNTISNYDINAYKIVRYPYLLIQNHISLNNDYVQSLINSTSKIIQWINSRYKEYIKGNGIRVSILEEKEFEILSPQDIIDYLAKSYDDFSVSTINLGSKKKVSLNAIFQKIFDLSEFTMFQIVSDYNLLNEVDKLLTGLLYDEYPELFSDDSFEKIKSDQKIFLAPRKLEQNPRINMELPIIYPLQFTEKVSKSSLSGKEIKYYTIGKGTPLVIVNAYSIGTEMWSRVIHSLSKYFYVVIWKVKGLYDKDRVNSNKYIYDLEEQVDDICQIVETEKFSKFHLVSWCSGAKSSIYCYEKLYEKILSYTIIAGEYAPYKNSEKDHSKFRKNIQLIAQMVDENEKMLKFYQKTINNGMFNHPIAGDNIKTVDFIFEIIPTEFKENVVGAFDTDEGMINFLNMCRDYYLYDPTEIIESIDIPILYISCECDHVAPSAQSLWADSHSKNSCLVNLKAASHYAVLERFKDVLQAIQYFYYIGFEFDGSLLIDYD